MLPDRGQGRHHNYLPRPSESVGIIPPAKHCDAEKLAINGVMGVAGRVWGCLFGQSKPARPAVRLMLNLPQAAGSARLVTVPS